MTPTLIDQDGNYAEYRLRHILADEFDLAREVAWLHAANEPELARSVELFIVALVARPPRWKDAERFAREIADNGYGSGVDLNYLREEVLHALLPLLYDLPEMPSELAPALQERDSHCARALAAARVVRLFPCAF